MSTITRESVRTLAQSLGWKPKDVITLCSYLQLPPPKERTAADLERLAAALTGSPTEVLDRLATPLFPGQRVVYTGRYPEWPHGRILIVELSWPQRTWVINPNTGRSDTACNLRTEDLRLYTQQEQ